MSDILKRTEMVFILDRSGSRSGLESDTIGGFNALLKKQKKEAGEAWVTTVLFDGKANRLHDRLPLADVAPMTEDDYEVGGCTALLDAVGSTIKHICNIHKYIRPEDVPDKTVVVIITDGQENASHHYDYKQVKQMIKKQKELGWEFIFLGANIDAAEEAGNLGIDADHAVDYMADAKGTALNYDVISNAVCSVRKGACLNYKWKEPIAADYAERKRK